MRWRGAAPAALSSCMREAWLQSQPPLRTVSPPGRLIDSWCLRCCPMLPLMQDAAQHLHPGAQGRADGAQRQPSGEPRPGYPAALFHPTAAAGCKQ